MTKTMSYGLGFRPPYYQHVVTAAPAVADFFEITTENFLQVGGRPQRFLNELRERYPVVAHGVGLSIAGAAPLNLDYLRRVRDLRTWLRPVVTSDHLCWTGNAHRNAHDLLPIPFTRAMLDHVSARVQQVQDTLDCRFYLENPSVYVAYAGNEMDEASFLAELSARTGCGLLLDVNNLFLNCINLGTDPLKYIATLPPEAIGYFHLAGHTVTGDVRIDTHDAPVCAEVWALYQVAANRFPLVPTLVEWDDNFPPYATLEAELERAKTERAAGLAGDFATLGATSLRQIAAAALAEAANSSEPAAPPASPNANVEPTRATLSSIEAIQETALQMIVQAENVTPDDDRLSLLAGGHPVGVQRGINVYNNAYFFRIHDILREDLPGLAALAGDHGFTQLLLAFLAEMPRAHYDIKGVGNELPTFLAQRPDQFSDEASNAALASIAALELSRSELYDLPEDEDTLAISELGAIGAEAWGDAVFKFKACCRVISTSHAVWDLWEAVANDSEWTAPPAAPSHYLVYRREDDIYHECLTPMQAHFLRLLAGGSSFGEACAALEGESADQIGGESVDADTVNHLVGTLAHLTNLGLVATVA